MFGRGSRKRLSSRSLTASGEPERGQPCNTCGDQCPGFALHKWRVYPFLQHLLCLAFLPASALLLRAASHQIKAWIQSKEEELIYSC